MTDRELMRQALSAFEAILFEKNIEATQIIARNARYSLREALSQPEQEPVALKQLRDLHKVQGSDGSWDAHPYGCGLYNGLELALSLFEKREPMFKEPDHPEQEPVATVTSSTGNPDIIMSWWHEPALPVGTKLYTAPPKREWVGLTDEEIIFIEQMNSRSYMAHARAIEAKLKSKNGGQND